MRLITKRIPDALYKKIHASVPLVCVDLVVTDVAKRHFLLGKRTNKPEQGKWFFPGGRLLKNERLKNAARRKLREELGLQGKIVGELGVYEYMSRQGYFPGTSAHTVVVIFLAEVKKRTERVRLDGQFRRVKWFQHIDRRWHDEVKIFLYRAGFK